MSGIINVATLPLVIGEPFAELSGIEPLVPNAETWQSLDEETLESDLNIFIQLVEPFIEILQESVEFPQMTDADCRTHLKTQHKRRWVAIPVILDHEFFGHLRSGLPAENLLPGDPAFSVQ